MKPLILAICTITALACGIAYPVTEIAPSASGGFMETSTAIPATAIPTVCDVQMPSEYTIIADAVYLRKSPAGDLAYSGIYTLHLSAGEVVVANCGVNPEYPYWCAITQGDYVGLWVWQGCAENNLNLKCEVLP